jgi:hypothetical protein
VIGLQHDGGAILTAMDAEAIKHLGGICQLLGVVLVLQEVLAFARYRGELARAVAWLRAQWTSAGAALRQLLRRRWQVVFAEAGTARVSLTAHSATVSTGRAELFTVRPGQSLQEQLVALGELVNQLRERVLAEPQERERAIAAEREARQGEVEALTERLEQATAALRGEVGELRETTTGGIRLRLEGVPLLLAGIIFTTWPDGIATALPNWPPLRVVLLFLGVYVLGRLTSGWLPAGEGRPPLSRPQVGCAVLWSGSPASGPGSAAHPGPSGRLGDRAA